MTFDIKNSKLYGQIMEALVSFFELEPDTATETDVHAKIEGSEPLSKLLDDAATKAVADVKDQVTKLSEKVTALESQVGELTTRAEAAEAKISEKDNRIAELQTEAAETAKKIEGLKEQHRSEVSILSGKIASLRAGKEKENDVDEGTQATEVGKGSDGADVHILQSSSLKKLVTRQSAN